MIINNINGFKIELDEEVLNDLEWLYSDIVVDILTEVERVDIENDYVRDRITEEAGSEMYYHHEADEIIDNTEYDDVNWIAKAYGIEFEGDFEDFKFRVAQAIKWDRESSEAWEVLNNIKIIEEEEVM